MYKLKNMKHTLIQNSVWVYVLEHTEICSDSCSTEAIEGLLKPLWVYIIITNSWTHWPPLSISHFLSLFNTHCSFSHALSFSQMRTGVRAAQKHNPILLWGEIKNKQIAHSNQGNTLPGQKKKKSLFGF